jgi:signal transduction histidine kinase
VLRSLRARLTFGLTAVLAAVVLTAGLLAAREVDRSERDALDDRLRRTAELSRATALAAVEQEVPAGDDRLDAVLSATRTSLRLVLGEIALLDTGDPPPGRRRRLPAGFSTFEAGGARYRAYVSSLRVESLDGLARLELTTRLTLLERREAALRSRLALLGASALALCALGVFLASGLVLRPLERLRWATASIARDEDLNRRVPAESGPSEVRALARAFNAMLARLSRSAADRERALAATQRFAADAGHELRTPLTAVRASLSSLARHPDLPAERRTSMASDALEQQGRLVALLDGLQAFARGDAAPERTELDLVEVADAALAAARERHPQTRWEAELPDEPVRLPGWEPGLRSMVDNLLENAVRHGRADGGGAVRLTVRPGELSVEDDGPGVERSTASASSSPSSGSTRRGHPAPASGWRSSPSRPPTTALRSRSATRPPSGARASPCAGTGSLRPCPPLPIPASASPAWPPWARTSRATSPTTTSRSSSTTGRKRRRSRSWTSTAGRGRSPGPARSRTSSESSPGRAR